jgi:hypothetical protein
MANAKDPVKFWMFLVALMLATAVAVLLLDISIKAAILEESNALRLAIERERNEQYVRRTEVPNPHGASGNGSYSSDELGVDATRLETGNAANRTKEPAKKVTARRTAKPRPTGSATEIPE